MKEVIEKGTAGEKNESHVALAHGRRASLISRNN
jgi:hypothetical protein